MGHICRKYSIITRRRSNEGRSQQRLGSSIVVVMIGGRQVARARQHVGKLFRVMDQDRQVGRANPAISSPVSYLNERCLLVSTLAGQAGRRLKVGHAHLLKR